MDKTENLLGALALAITDRQTAGMMAASSASPSAISTILTLSQTKDLSVTGLADIVGISHSAMVRLIDGLEKHGQVLRKPGSDKRVAIVELTPAGSALAAQLSRARGRVLKDILSRLSATDRRALQRIAAKLLIGLTTDRRTADHICRFCDEAACGLDDCPVEQRALALERL